MLDVDGAAVGLLSQSAPWGALCSILRIGFSLQAAGFPGGLPVGHGGAEARDQMQIATCLTAQDSTEGEVTAGLRS